MKRKVGMLLVPSDFSFAERAIIDVWIWLWFTQRVWSTDKFASLQWSKIRNFDLKSIITLLIFMMLPVQATFDIIWTYLKYKEGFIVDPTNGKIYTKPTYYIIGNEKTALWTKEDILLQTITEYLLAFDFAFQIGTLALMQAFWSHLSSQMGGKPFMRTTKFRFYVGWLFASIILFPLARYVTSNHFVLAENVPELIFSIQLFVIFLLGIKNGRELNNLLSSIQQTSSPSGQETILRICYFIEMNQLLMFGTFLTSIGMLILTVDAIIFKQAIQSKFLLDMLLIHANFGSLILWATMILIVYPRYYITGTAGHIVNYSAPSAFKNRASGSPETGNVPRDNPRDSHVIDFRKAKTTSIQPLKKMSTRGSQFNVNVEKSINSIKEEQMHHIEVFRHKTSFSISSSSGTSGSPQPSPSFPPPPLIPPPTTNGNTFTV
uniref:Transcription factor HIVEP3 n=1 Tax=Anthurium amnicola TaxID=1678845 RepID=A0A1D1YAH1_9ARAE